MKAVAMVIMTLLIALPMVLLARPADFQHAKIVNYSDDRDPLDFEIKESNEYYPYLPDVQNQPELPSNYAPEWGTDRLVSDEWTMNNSVISFDYDYSGYLYVMGLSNTYTNDTLKLFKSTDQGLTWQMVWQFGTAPEWQIKDFEMKVNHTGSDPYVYFFLTDSFDNERTLWFGKITQPAMTTAWTMFDPDTSTSLRNPLRLSMDNTDDATPRIWCTYEREAGSDCEWYSLYSTDGGSTWANILHASGRGASDPYVTFGTDYIYVVAVYTAIDDSNALRMYRRPFSGTANFFWVSNRQLVDRAYPCVASTQEVYPDNRVDILYQEGAGTDRRIRESYSPNGTQTIYLSELWPMTGDYTSIRPYVGAGWESINFEFCGVATKPGTFDSLIVGYHVGGTWMNRIVPNDYRATGEITPQATILLNGRAVVYRQYGSNNVWFESFENTAVEEEPAQILPIWNVSTLNGGIAVNFSLTSPQIVSLKIYDIAGRNIYTENMGIVSEGSHSMEISTQGISSGRYFVSLAAGDKNFSKSVILF